MKTSLYPRLQNGIQLLDDCTFIRTERTLCYNVSQCSGYDFYGDNIMMARLVVKIILIHSLKVFCYHLKTSKVNSSLKSGLTLRIPRKMFSKTFSIKEVYLVFVLQFGFFFY